MFREFDRDENGFIDINEAKNVVEKLFPDDVYNTQASFSKDDMSRFWDYFNTYKDDKDGLVNYEEFLIWYETTRMNGVIR